MNLSHTIKIFCLFTLTFISVSAQAGGPPQDVLLEKLLGPVNSLPDNYEERQEALKKGQESVQILENDLARKILTELRDGKGLDDPQGYAEAYLERNKLISPDTKGRAMEDRLSFRQLQEALRGSNPNHEPSQEIQNILEQVGPIAERLAPEPKKKEKGLELENLKINRGAHELSRSEITLIKRGHSLIEEIVNSPDLTEEEMLELLDMLKKTKDPELRRKIEDILNPSPKKMGKIRIDEDEVMQLRLKRAIEEIRREREKRAEENRKKLEEELRAKEEQLVRDAFARFKITPPDIWEIRLFEKQLQPQIF